jgi:hypothetical protein
MPEALSTPKQVAAQRINGMRGLGLRRAEVSPRGLRFGDISSR